MVSGSIHSSSERGRSARKSPSRSQYLLSTVLFGLQSDKSKSPIKSFDLFPQLEILVLIIDSPKTIFKKFLISVEFILHI